MTGRTHVRIVLRFINLCKWCGDIVQRTTVIIDSLSYFLHRRYLPRVFERKKKENLWFRRTRYHSFRIVEFWWIEDKQFEPLICGREKQIMEVIVINSLDITYGHNISYSFFLQRIWDTTYSIKYLRSFRLSEQW